MASSGSDSEISDSEIRYYKRKTYEQFGMGKYNIKSKTGKFTCPFCKGRKKQVYEFEHLAQHARGTGGFGRKNTAKVKAKHLALAMYLDDWLDEALDNRQNSPGPDYDELLGEGEQGL